MAQKTAVEWFFDKIKSHFEHDGDVFETVCFTFAIAKQMEKEQIIDAIESTIKSVELTEDKTGFFVLGGEGYYNKNYKLQ